MTTAYRYCWNVPLKLQVLTNVRSQIKQQNCEKKTHYSFYFYLQFQRGGFGKGSSQYYVELYNYNNL